jgi:hypothetical protein
MVRGAANRGVALTTGGVNDKRISLTPVSKKKVVDSVPKPSKKKKKKRSSRRARPLSSCDLCGSAYRTRPTAAGKRCFDCWQSEMKLIDLWSAVPKGHACVDRPNRSTCSDERHHAFYRAAVYFSIRINSGSTDAAPIIRSVHTLLRAKEQEQAARDRQQRERRREAAAKREAARAKAMHEQQERARKAEIERREARARRLMDEIRRETPIEDLREAMARLQGRWNEQ